MTTPSSNNKITLTHPRTLRETKVDLAIYDPFKAAIMQSLKGSRGKTFTQLADDVAEIILKKMPGFKGPVPWYTTSLRLALETRGIVNTFSEKGMKLSCL